MTTSIGRGFLAVNKATNDQWIPLLGEAFAIVLAQPRVHECIFPYNIRSVTAAWQRACNDLSIHDLRFHDLRHEGISRLFEAGLSIQEVSMVSGHRSWNNLKRYTQLRPESLHAKFDGPSIEAARLPTTIGEGVYLGDWADREALLAAFGLTAKDLVSTTILFAAAFAEDGAFILLCEDAQLFEITLARSNCTDWLPEKTSINSIRHRVKTGRLGWRGKMNIFADELLATLAALS